MANYTTLLAVLSVVMSMAATGRCSWISGGAPPPSSVGDIMPQDNIDPNALADSFMIQGKDVFAPGPATGDFMAQGKSSVAEGPSADLMIQGKSSVAEGPSADLVTQGKSSVGAEGPAAGGGDLITQDKEAVPADGPKFAVQGRVYCDPCRIQFPTKISYPLPNTKIVLACHKQDSTEETYRLEGLSNEKGRYILTAVGDHAEDVCEVTVSESPDPNCPEIMEDENHVRVSLTNKHGALGDARFANPLGFMVKDADIRCKEVLDELGFTGI